MKTFIKISTYLLLLLLFYAKGQSQISFNNLDSLFAFSNKNSSIDKIAKQQSLLAKYTKIAAQANSVNFRNPISFASTNNIQLPVNFIPSDAFGGVPGAFKQITLGQQYISNFNFNPQIDLLNLQNLARIKSAELNVQLTSVNNQIQKKLLYESLAAVYYNITSINEQIIACEINVKAADSIVIISQNKFDIGIIRNQDLNNSKVNLLNLNDKVQQLNFNKQQQINALKILLDIPENSAITIESNSETHTKTSETPISKLENKYAFLQSEYLKNELKANRLSLLPVVSLFYYQGWQQNSNQKFFDNNAKWIQSKYIGFKVSMPFPADVNKYSQNYTNKINYTISNIQSEHTHLQNELTNKNTSLEYQKALSSFETGKQILELKTNNYEKSINQYKEGILSLDLLLTTFSDLVNSELNVANLRATLSYTQAKIKINNLFK